MAKEPKDDDHIEVPIFRDFEHYKMWGEDNPDPRGYNPHICDKHWWPAVKAGQEGGSANGLTLTVVLMGEAFARLPDDFDLDPKNTTALNSFFANTTEPTCCWLGDEKMEWLWWLMGQELCLARQFPQHPSGKPACLFPKGHSGDHMHRRESQSIFNFMEEFPNG